MKTKLLYILITLSFASCVVPRNYSRAKEKVDRIVNKFPEILQNDTVVLHDTLIVPVVEVDTIAEFKENDTIIIEKERLKLRIVRLPGDTIEVFAKCDTDTIVITKGIPIYTVEKHNLLKSSWLGLSKWTWLLVAVIVALFLYIIFFKKK